MNDLLVLHEFETVISAKSIEERADDYRTLTATTMCRFDYIKGLLAFVGLELMTYDSGVVHRDRAGNMHVRLASKFHNERIAR